MESYMQDYFHYSRLERGGALLLLGTSLIGFSLAILLPLFLLQAAFNFQDFGTEVTAFEAFFEKNSIFDKNTITFVEEEKETEGTLELFSFDPNTVSQEELLSLGIPSNVATKWVNYRASGAKFYQSEDVKKVYGLTDADYQRLAPYIKLPKRQQHLNVQNPDYSTFPNKTKNSPTNSLSPKKLFSFNPNTVTQKDLLKMGLSAKVAQTVMNFRNKGGTFRRPEDFSRIYGISETDFLLLKPFIHLINPNVNSDTHKSKNQPIAQNEPQNIPISYETPQKTIDINKADETQWKQLSGIGNYYAKRIVRFRESLGGFVSIAQVAETYHLPDSTFQKIKPFLVRSPIFRKLAINTASTKDLTTHPYLNTQEAKVLIAFREQHGTFQSIDDVKKVRAFNPQRVERLAPYLDFKIEN